MELVVKDMDIATGNVQVVLLNKQDARRWDLHHSDRIFIKKGRKSTIAMLDIAESKKAVPPGKIGCFEEVLDALKLKHGDKIRIEIARKPKSVAIIRKKLDGKSFSEAELRTIVRDIVNNRLTDIELTSYVVASYTLGMTDQEIAFLTKAMRDTGDKLVFKKKPLVDLHCIGGVPGNRTTMIVVPILIAAGLTVPKTSSRAITSPSGTADTMEVLCSVTLNKKELTSIVKKAGGFITWGGAVNLAPADDRIIRVEHPISIDAEGQMLASIMSKKASVSATHLLIDIPIGSGAKVPNKKEGEHLANHFLSLGKALGLKVKVIYTDGSQPVGNGIGPNLEARDVLWLLQNDPRGPKDLRRRSLHMASEILEFASKARKGKGLAKATEILESGEAYKAFEKMLKAQKGKMIDADTIKPGKHSFDLKSGKTGSIFCLQNSAIAKIARLAGAPQDKSAGVYIHKHCGQKIKKKDVIMTVYSPSKTKLKFATDFLKKSGGIEVK